MSIVQDFDLTNLDRLLRAFGERHPVGRALGASPFCRNNHFARLSADLPVFMRQSHAERDLAALGEQSAQQPAGVWQL